MLVSRQWNAILFQEPLTIGGYDNTVYKVKVELGHTLIEKMPLPPPPRNELVLLFAQLISCCSVIVWVVFHVEECFSSVDKAVCCIGLCVNLWFYGFISCQCILAQCVYALCTFVCLGVFMYVHFYLLVYVCAHTCRSSLRRYSDVTGRQAASLLYQSLSLYSSGSTECRPGFKYYLSSFKYFWAFTFVYLSARWAGFAVFDFFHWFFKPCKLKKKG